MPARAFRIMLLLVVLGLVLFVLHLLVGPVPITFQRMVDAKFALVGTVDQVKRQIAELCEASNPDWFGWYLDQGLMDQGEVLRQLEAFATEILPGFA